MDAVAELGRNSVSKHHFSLSMDMSRLTRDETAKLVSRRPNSQARTGTGEYSFFLFS